MTSDRQLPFAFGSDVDEEVDREARQAAVDPTQNVALSASAGTGKTRVLVDRYVNLLRAGVDPSNILAVTFTRKAAAEMRQRIITTLRTEAARGTIEPALWRGLRDRLHEVAISTIDAFCLSLLREFPLEADLDPGFEVADETEVPRYVEEALDRSLHITRALARDDEDVLLVFAQLGERRLRSGLASLLDRRLVVDESLRRLRTAAASRVTTAAACDTVVERLSSLLVGLSGGLDRFLDDGPLAHPRYALFVQDVRRLCGTAAESASAEDGVAKSRLRATVDSVAAHFTTQAGTPRLSLTDYKAADCRSADAWKRHRDVVRQIAPVVVDIVERFRRDLNFVLARGVSRAFQIARAEYRRTLERHGVLDFAELVERTLALFDQMDEFARSRYLLEARYQHVLVDEFQDTSRAQWRLVRQLVRAWSEGAGLAQEGRLPPTIFIVGDVKQSIYGFRDADVSLFGRASRFIDALRPGEPSKRSISRNFRSVPQLLAFVNDFFDAIDRDRMPRPDGFVFDADDHFPVGDLAGQEAGDGLGLVAADSAESAVDAVVTEISCLLGSGAIVRDRDSGLRRSVRAGDIAILFRSRDSHREFEAALEAKAIPTYVYKGLGFFDADEIKDAMALLRYLGRPISGLRAAAFLRSRFIRLSDEGLKRIGSDLAVALTAPAIDERWGLDDEDARVLRQARRGVVRWLAAVDRVPPADLFEAILDETAYDCELQGPRLAQARENLKKMRGLVRRIQNRGYVTFRRIADHLDRLSAGDESNATIDAVNAVSLMTVHAAKGLEFPIVFLVNLARGTGGRRPPIRVAPVRVDEAQWEIGAENCESPDVPSVTVGDFQPDADDDVQRDREETKRLLYVAMTRARDRLYLATVLKDGRLQPGVGSLAGVLPTAFRELFDRAATAADDAITWDGGGGQRHVFRICRPDSAAMPAGVSTDTRAVRDDDFGPVEPGDTPVRIAVSAAAPLESVARAVVDDDASPSRTGAAVAEAEPRIVGRLVHRLLQSRADLDEQDFEMTVARALSLYRIEERAAISNPSAVAAAAARLWRGLRRHPVHETLLAGDCLYEVPFSYRRVEEPGVVLRGVIDCLVLESSGRVTVLELKTGSREPSHDAQLAVYVEAARALFPGCDVRGVLVYPPPERGFNQTEVASNFVETKRVDPGSNEVAGPKTSKT